MSQAEFNRRILYADVPLIVLSTMAMDEPPSPLWSRFQLAGEHMRSKDRGMALDELERLATDPSSPSQVQLLAWHWLAQLDVAPSPELAQLIQGVVIEGSSGANLLALYADGSASILNSDGTLTDVNDKPPIAQLARSALEIAQQIAPDFPLIPTLPAPPPGTRITLLTPAALRSREIDASYPAAAPLLQVASQVRTLLPIR